MERNEDRTMKGLSVKLCFRPSSVPKKAGRLYYQIIFRRASYQYNSQYQIYETEWSKQTGLIIIDALSQRGKELMTIRKRTDCIIAQTNCTLFTNETYKKTFFRSI